MLDAPGPGHIGTLLVRAANSVPPPLEEVAPGRGRISRPCHRSSAVREGSGGCAEDRRPRAFAAYDRDMTVIPPVRSAGRRTPFGRMPKLVLGLVVLALLAAAVFAGAALRRSGAGPAEITFRISGYSDTVVLTVPGASRDGCAFSAKITTCTTTVQVSGEGRAHVRAGTAGAPPPSSVRLLYWGCGEGDGVASCTLTGSPRGSPVRVSTSDPKDEAARQRCADAVEAPEPESGAAVTRKVSARAGGRGPVRSLTTAGP
ncbi:hypothetical protein GCM10027075_33030 [Streptomyces heilongjiangensis]